MINIYPLIQDGKKGSPKVPYSIKNVKLVAILLSLVFYIAQLSILKAHGLEATNTKNIPVIFSSPPTLGPISGATNVFQGSTYVYSVTVTSQGTGGGGGTQQAAKIKTAAVNKTALGFNWYLDNPAAGILTPSNGTVNIYWNAGYNSATLYCDYNNANGGAEATTYITITSPLVVGSISPINQNIISGTNAVMLNSGVASGGSGNYTYQWQSSPTGDQSSGGGTSSTSSAKATVLASSSSNSSWSDISGATNILTYTPTNLYSTTYYHMKVKDNGTGNTYYSNQAVVNVYPAVTAPNINTANQTVNFGGSATFTMLNIATGGAGNGTYLYYLQTLNNGNWTDLAGQNGTSQSFPTGALTVNSSFRLRVNSAGFNGYSNVVQVTVNLTVPVVAATTTTTINPGGTVSFNLSTLPQGGTGGYQYTLQSSSDFSNWSDISSVTSNLPITSNAINNSTNLRVKVSSGSASIASSNSVPITVNLTAPSIAASSSTTINPGGSVNITTPTLPQGATGNYTYTLQSNSNGNGTWLPVSSATTNTSSTAFSTGNVYINTNFRVMAYSGSVSIASINTIPVSVNLTAPTILANSGTTINLGGTVALSIGTLPTGATGQYGYTIQSSTDGGNTWLDVSTATSSTANISTNQLYNSTSLRVKVTSGGASIVSSNTIPVTVNLIAPAITANTTTTINIGGFVSLAITSLATGGATNYNYALQSSSDGSTWNTLISSVPTNAPFNSPPLSNSTNLRVYVTSGSAFIGSNTIPVTVNLTAPVIAASAKTINYGSMVNISMPTPPAGGAAGYTYAWQISGDGTTWNPLTNLSNTTTSFISPNLYAVTYYQVITKSGSASIPSNVLTINPNQNVQINPSQAQNYVAIYQPRQAKITNQAGLQAAKTDKTKVQTTIQYFDGLGRPIQTVQAQASPLGNDMVQAQTYDQFGRETTKYLPYTLTSTQINDGSYKPYALITDQTAFYNKPPSGVTTIITPQAVTIYEPSPLNRVLEQGEPGDAWQPAATGISTAGHTLKVVYTTNNTTNYLVNQYTVNINSSGNRTLVFNGGYLKAQLYVTITRDENWSNTQNTPNTATDPRLNTIEEYKDKDGHVVLKRTYNYNKVNSVFETLSTYYVYDNLGNLCFVLPPLAGADGATGITSAANQTILKNLCYQYCYDERNRLVQKKIPGKGWEYMIYNTIDQLVATQDSLQRVNKQWLFTKYDALGRTIQTGIWNNGNIAVTRATLQSTLSNIKTNLWETPVNSGNGYTNIAWPTSGVTATLGLDYYDGYKNIPLMPTTYTLNTGISNMTRGLLTVKKTAVLNKPTDLLWDVMYYDDLGRNIKTYTQHYLGAVVDANNYDLICTTYNFTNAPTTATRQHYKTAGGSNPAQLAVTIFNKYVYDHIGRKLRAWETINNGNPILLSQMVYNEVGQVLNKQLHSTDSIAFAQTVGYTYNERGWLLGSSAPLFAMQLQYNNVTPLNGITPVAQFNGNIASQLWGTSGSLINNYRYTYDNLNRLTSGISNANNNETGITYDLMGNIKTLNRTQANILIDQLSYTYTNGGNATNQLQSITDAAADNTTIPTGTTSYTYDGNGNMLSNNNAVNTSKNKTFTYNLLNLPQLVTVPSGTSTFIYDATGNKLRKITALGTAKDTVDYISGIQYKNRNIDFIQTEEGKIAFNKTTGVYDYEYYLGDNLGNTRVTFNIQNSVATALQRDDYMPFGYEISNGSPANPKNEYLYNKKELQEELGEYDYGARFYDPLLGRWNCIDPLAERGTAFSPYEYASSNPVSIVDPDGRENVVVVGNQGGHPSSDQAKKYPKHSKHFLQAALKEAKQLKKSHTENGEGTTIVVYKGNYTKEQLAKYQGKAEKAGIKFVVAQSSSEIANYINTKSTTDNFGLADVTNRINDAITDFSYVGHGWVNNLMPGYNAITDGVDKDPLLTSSFNTLSFSANCNANLNACASGFNVMDDFVNRLVGGTVVGYKVTMQWGENGLGTYRPYDKFYYRPGDPRRNSPDRPVVPEKDRTRIEQGKRKE